MMNWQQCVVAILLLLCVVRIGWGIYSFFQRAKSNGNPCENCVTGCELKQLLDKNAPNAGMCRKTSSATVNIVVRKAATVFFFKRIIYPLFSVFAPIFL